MLTRYSLLAVWASLVATACIPKQQDDTSADGAAPLVSTNSAQGVACMTDPNTNVRLCQGTTACPNTTVDQGAFSGCGFRTLTENFDLECLCNGVYVCPIGVAQACGDVASLLAGRTSIDICNLVSTGACQQVGSAPSTTGGNTGTGGTSSSCDPDCLSDCSNVPTCVEACGC
jgi:hypothetical protein